MAEHCLPYRAKQAHNNSCWHCPRTILFKNSQQPEKKWFTPARDAARRNLQHGLKPLYDCLIVRSVGGRSAYDWSYAWSRDQQRLEKIVRLVVAINDRSYGRSCPPTIDRMINSVGRRMGSDLNPRNISTFYSVSEQPIGGTTGRKVARPVARLIVRPLTIWNSRFQVLNMTIDLVATDLLLAITHDLSHQSYDLCHQSYDRSKIDPSFQHFSIAGRS